MQEVDLNDAAWNEVVSTRLPANLEAQARQLNAWTRKREVRSVPDLLRALLVYASCQYSFQELGIWAVLKGIGSLCERGWRKRLDRSRAWIAWVLSELLGVHQTPVWLQRTTASHLHLEDEQGQTISLKERVKHLAGNSLKEVEGCVRLPSSGERARVRVVCYRLPAEQAQKACERKEATLRKKHGRTYNREVVWWANFVLLVTTTQRAQWSGKDLVALYRARWHIELFFKRLKQCLHLHQLRHQDWERARSVVQLYLIVWGLQEQEAQWMREVLTSVLEPLAEDVCEVGAGEQNQRMPEEEQEWVLSSWTLAHLCGEQVRTMLRGTWSRRRIQECQHALRRYVRRHRRKRGHRESEQRAWLQSRGRLPAVSA